MASAHIDPALREPAPTPRAANVMQPKPSSSVKPEFAIGSSTADLIYGWGPHDKSGARARHTPREGWQLCNQARFANLTEGAAGGLAAGQRERNKGVTLGTRVHAHATARSAARRASFIARDSLEASAGPVVSREVCPWRSHGALPWEAASFRLRPCC